MAITGSKYQAFISSMKTTKLRRIRMKVPLNESMVGVGAPADHGLRACTGNRLFIDVTETGGNAKNLSQSAALWKAGAGKSKPSGEQPPARFARRSGRRLRNR